MQDALDRADAMTIRDEGDARAALDAGPRRLDAEFELPMLAHACLEPPNFTADFRGDACEVWGPTQDPRYLRQLVAAAVGLSEERVQVHPSLAGGGFGRRLAVDYGVEAALISRTLREPVQVVWTREDDLRHDYYRTPSLHRVSAAVGPGGEVSAWWHRLVTAPLVAHLETADRRDPGTPLALYDVQGAADIPYAIPAIRVDHAAVDVGIQMGSWRSVSHSFNTFVVNAFVDEIARFVGEDPLALHLRLLGTPRVARIELPLPGRRGRPTLDIVRLRAVLEKAAEASEWGRPVGPQRGRGIACTHYKRSYAAHVAEVTVEPGGGVGVDRVVSVLDCGRVVNPSGAKAQMEGAVIDGLATVFKWAVTLDEGGVQQSNFHDYPLIRFSEAPRIETHLMESSEDPSGAGEPPYPSVAPAICNAIFAATGRRVRHLPIGPRLAESVR
ncbi:MAG: molybdopterin-dependent oxidoreductase [Gemmatimonadetes bacterium]|nr:molybdopterin-dependent oxidoreductase [Gemmatimonadota bacterium]